jgi:biopolymer transport protein ExbD
LKLTKTDAGGEIVMDMTPMIDIVFQLIIFFMLLMDMSTKDLEDLVLPKAESASPDKPNPLDRRPVINITSDGRILVKRDVLYDPNNDDGYEKVKKFLAEKARLMPKARTDPTNPSSPIAPDKPVLVRADQATPFKHIQKVMEMCGLQGIQIWKIELAAAEVAKDEGGGDAGGQ